MGSGEGLRTVDQPTVCAHVVVDDRRCPTHKTAPQARLVLVQLLLLGIRQPPGRLASELQPPLEEDAPMMHGKRPSLSLVEQMALAVADDADRRKPQGIALALHRLTGQRLEGID